MNKSVMVTIVHVFLWIYVSFVLGKHLEVELPDHRVGRYLLL